MKPRRTLLLSALLLLPHVARAGDLPVSYTVDDKLLKAGAISGTMLTFTLHTDDACALAPVHTDDVAIDDVTLVSRLKLFTPKGGVKLPKTAEIRHTLAGVTQTGNLFLMVTGTGISAVGGECQPQAAVAVGGASFAFHTANITTGGGFRWFFTSGPMNSGYPYAPGGDVASVLAALNTNQAYTCSFQFDDRNFSTSSNFDGLVTIYGIRDCTLTPPTPTPTPTPLPTPTGTNLKRVFVTSTTSNSNLGGLAGADATCNRLVAGSTAPEA